MFSVDNPYEVVSPIASGNRGVGPVCSDSLLQVGDAPGQYMPLFNFVVDAAAERLNVSFNLCQPLVDRNKAFVHLVKALVDLGKAFVHVGESIADIFKLSRTEGCKIVD